MPDKSTPEAHTEATTDDFARLYAEWRYAKATWDAQSYSPEFYAIGLPEDIDGDLCTATCDALNAFLLHPAATIRQLAVKLSVFRDEEIADGWEKAPEIVLSLAADAHRIAISCNLSKNMVVA
ncbi:MAG: hypothetical protein R3E21_08205 [Caenibius sp.]